MTEVSDITITYRFSTAWGPFNEAVMEAMSKRFPTLRIRLDYDEPGMQFGGHMTAAAGKIQQLAENAYRAPGTVTEPRRTPSHDMRQNHASQSRQPRSGDNKKIEQTYRVEEMLHCWARRLGNARGTSEMTMTNLLHVTFSAAWQTAKEFMPDIPAIDSGKTAH